MLLGDWIQQDGLKCLKIKLRGDGRGLGLRAHRAGGATRLPRRGPLAEHRLQLHREGAGIRQRHPRQTAAGRARDLCPHALCGAALRLRPGARHAGRARRFSAQAALPRRERPRLGVREAGPAAGLERRGAEDLQDPDRRAAQPVLGQGARHAADGAGPHQSRCWP